MFTAHFYLHAVGKECMTETQYLFAARYADSVDDTGDLNDTTDTEDDTTMSRSDDD